MDQLIHAFMSQTTGNGRDAVGDFTDITREPLLIVIAQIFCSCADGTRNRIHSMSSPSLIVCKLFLCLPTNLICRLRDSRTEIFLDPASGIFSSRIILVVGHGLTPVFSYLLVSSTRTANGIADS